MTDEVVSRADTYPAEFKRYVLVDHQRWANGQPGMGSQFKGMALHAKNTAEMSAWGVGMPSLHFSPDFLAFLERGVKDARDGREFVFNATRWARVEDAMRWLDEEDGPMGIVLRHFQAPRWARAMSNTQLGNKTGLSEEGIKSWRNRALRRLWWRLGGNW